MMSSVNYAMAVVLVVGLPVLACGGRGTDDTAAAPADTAEPTYSSSSDTAASPDTLADPQRQPAVATPPITPPPEAAQDTPPSGAAPPSGQAEQGGALQVTEVEYEGWRQYSVNCARCHGQDVLPNPVAANLLISLGPGGPIDTEQKFFEVVNEGRPDRGMPAFKDIMSPEQIRAVYAYVEGRAEKRIAPGRPARPST
jgi:mono/diheme cytochrome c family protein